MEKTERPGGQGSMGEKRPAPPRSTSDDQKKKMGNAAIKGANKDKK